jgi:CheY-like chemotaxis protein/HPt (histidine-containing phosphotransfer) domain-containing protein
MMRIEVRDTGIGMSEPQLATLFRPFTQADATTTRRYGGTGLGLAISKRLAKALGGDIAVTSHPGVGSSFTLCIPTDCAGGVEMVSRLDDIEPHSSQPRDLGETARLRGRILVADDGRDNQRLICTILGDAGADVTVAHNGREAVRLAEAQPPFDLVLMDMQMPELDGYAATAELRARGNAVPIIAITAHAMAEDRQRCIAVGCGDYLTKPIDAESLLAVVRRHLAPATLPPALLNEPVNGQPLRSTLIDHPRIGAIIPQYVAELPEQVAALANSLAIEQWSDLARSLHRLKGSGGGHGFAAITELAAAAEQALNEQQPLAEVTARVEQLIQCIRSVEGYEPGREPAVSELKADANTSF